MIYIGDVHGKYFSYKELTGYYGETIQVGDLGIGFGMEEKTFSKHHRFIRGNHDSPDLCRAHPNCTADGHIDDEGRMFIGGADSIDKEWRTPGLDWWYDEELSPQEFEPLLEKYIKEKPEVMVTHDVADSVARHFFPFYTNNESASTTRHYLDLMFKEHKPRLWIFGHWHTRRDSVIDGTRFVCLE